MTFGNLAVTFSAVLITAHRERYPFVDGTAASRDADKRHQINGKPRENCHSETMPIPIQERIDGPSPMGRCGAFSCGLAATEPQSEETRARSKA